MTKGINNLFVQKLQFIFKFLKLFVFSWSTRFEYDIVRYVLGKKAYSSASSTYLPILLLCAHTGDLVRVELPHAVEGIDQAYWTRCFWLELSQYVWIFISSSLLHRWCLVDGAYCSYVYMHPLQWFPASNHKHKCT